MSLLRVPKNECINYFQEIVTRAFENIPNRFLLADMQYLKPTIPSITSSPQNSENLSAENNCIKSFTELGIGKSLAHALATMNITYPNDVQVHTRNILF